ncbi:MAG: glycosyltransferase family 39 protein [Isosphaeraceae bacterium]|nr:glycosyltransferase family 39 protein [Isosphaeraceae bacterium]
MTRSTASKLRDGANAGAREWAVIAAITLVGAVVRLAGLGQAGATHFDEGIYLLAAGWSLQGDGLAAIDPGLIPYAPPLHVILIGLGYRVLGASDITAILVSIALSTVAIACAGALGRRIFGPGAGAAAAALIAFSGPQVVFARSALTEPALLLCLLIAVQSGLAFLRSPGPLAAIGLGVSVGLAQLAKYNGWMAGAIVGLAAATGSLLDRTVEGRLRARLAIAWGLLAAVVAAIVYAPWFAFVERHGGYRALLDHQRSYLGGWGSWPDHLAAQWNQEVALSGGPPLRGVAALAAVAVVVLLTPGPTAGASRRLRGLAFLGPIALGLVIVGAPNAGWWIGAATSLVALAGRDSTPERRLLAFAWFLFAILTPFYHPYARLWLPLETFSAISAAGALVAVRSVSEPTRDPWGRAAIAAAAIAAIIAAMLLPGRSLPDALGPTDSLRSAVSRVIAKLPPGVATVRMLARPTVIFHAAGRVSARRLAGLDDLQAGAISGEYALIDEIQLDQESGARARLEASLAGWEIVATEENRLGPAARLDVDPAAARAGTPAPSVRLLLLRKR